MTTGSRRRALPLLALLLVVLGAPAAHAQGALDFSPCGAAPDVECATFAAPLDYDRSGGRTVDLHLARVPAADQDNRIGTLFFNFGGPGAEAAAFVEAFGRDLFPALSERYDVVGLDPRGTGESEGAIDCEADQETQGIYSAPFPDPLTFDENAFLAKVRGYTQRCLSLNPRALISHFSTANVARDLDAIRAALGEDRLHYLGFSYGTFLGATYASLFPQRYGRMVLDGPVNADAYVNDPEADLAAQTSGFERALGRFLQACAVDQTACAGFGGGDPWRAFDKLIDDAEASPIPAARFTPDPRPVGGDEVIQATIGDLYARQLWGELAAALSQAAAGDGTGIRALADGAWGNNGDGTFDPGTDRYFVLGAVEQGFGRSVADAFRAGERSWTTFDHFSDNVGYVNANYAVWPVTDADRFTGPFRVAADANTPLVVANTYDPATPLNGARRLVEDLGRARFLKVRADGHTAYGLTGPCADAAIEGYLLGGALPAAGTVCEADQPFEPLTRTAATAGARALRHTIGARLRTWRHGTR